MDIRDTFARMAMNDEETVALVAGGHTFGKAHGAAPPDGVVGPAPTDATLVEQGFGWQNKHGSGKGVDTITSGLEGAWTADPAKWDGGYFHNLFSYEWELGKGPGGAHQWYPKDGAGAGTIPDAHDPSKSHSPMMLTSDIALLKDPAYNVISKRFHENPKEFEEAFAKAWYKLTHRDMGPVTRCVGPEVAEPQLWQDPCPAPSTEELLTDEDVSALKTKILEESGLSIAQLVATAWASACTFRRTDYRGGAVSGRFHILCGRFDWDLPTCCVFLS
jgi:catalase-peroxidase